jgi:DNA-binding CsgD family transcriptional regulator
MLFSVAAVFAGEHAPVMGKSQVKWGLILGPFEWVNSKTGVSSLPFAGSLADFLGNVSTRVHALKIEAELSEEITSRETDVLRMLAQGLVNKEIAARLGISEHTVKFHISSILDKLGASTRTEAVTLGIRRGLIPI